MKLLPILFCLAATSPLSAAIVLNNLPASASSSQTITGPTASSGQLRYGFEFTVHGGDHELQAVTLQFGTPPVTPLADPLKISVWKSPSGPDNAVLVATLIGPNFPASTTADWLPPSGTFLTDNTTYFLQMEVNSGNTAYPLNLTTSPLSGPWDYEGSWTQSGSARWAPSPGVPPVVQIKAAVIPEPLAGVLSGVGFLMLLRRRPFVRG